MQEISSEKGKRKRIKPDLGMIVFLCVLVYIIAWNIIYLSKDKISYYEVTPGEMVESDRFNAMILCEDRIEAIPEAGVIYYLARSGSKVSTASPVYCLDKTRNIQQIISETTDEQVLSEEELNVIYNELDTFSNGYDLNSFSDVYQFKATTSTILIDALSESLIDSGAYDSSLQIIRPTEPGYVFYYEDGLEGVTVDSFTPEMLDVDEYKFRTLNNEGDVSASDSAYKLITAEEWTILFKLKEYQYEKYIQDEYVQVKFLKDDQIVWGQVDLIERDEELYCAIHFTNSMVRYAGSRFTDVEIIFSSEKGLKVPNSSIVVKEFYTVPKDYAEVSTDTLVVNIHSIDKDGNPVINSKVLDIYEETEEYYLVSTNDLAEGTNIIQKTTGNTYTISNKIPINGVYNINRGYAKFNEVTILTKNDDFSIIQPNDRYGLVEYDHIVLNGDSVVDEEIVYQQ